MSNVSPDTSFSPYKRLRRVAETDTPVACYPSEDEMWKTPSAANAMSAISGNFIFQDDGYSFFSAGAAAGQKVTVTRAAAQRSREMGSKMYGLVHRAATADGADKSGLTALTWPVVANFAVDAAMAVALANTLFFAAASGESKGRVALYLLITIAPFAVIAPLIGEGLF